MDRHVRRLLDDYLVRAPLWSWVFVLFAMLLAVLLRASPNEWLARLIAVFSGWIFYAGYSQYRHQRQWLRTVATLPVGRHSAARVQWFVTFGLLIPFSLAIYIAASWPHVGKIFQFGTVSLGPVESAAFLPLIGLAFGSLIDWTSDGLASTRRSMRLVVAGTWLLLIAISVALIWRNPFDPYWHLTFRAALVMAFIVAAYTWHHVESYPAPRHSPWGDLRKTGGARHGKLTGWSAQRMKIFKVSLAVWAMLAAFQIWDMINLMFMAIMLPMFCSPRHFPGAAMLPSIRVARSLPLTVWQLTANILLTAYIPAAGGILILLGLTIAGKSSADLPLVVLTLVAMPPIMMISAICAGWIGVGLASGLNIILFIFFRETQLADFSLPLVVAFYTALAAAGVWTTRQRLLVGREAELQV